MDLTRISPNKTGDGYQSIKESLNPDDLDLKMETARFKNPLRLEGEIVWFEKGLLFCVNVEGIKELICARCLEPFEQVFKKKMTFNYELVYRQPINVLPELSEELFVDHRIGQRGDQILCVTSRITGSNKINTRFTVQIR